jgi:hypothetical protein
MENSRAVLQSTRPEGTRENERPNLRWEHIMIKDIRALGFTKWSTVAMNKEN